MAKNVKGGYYTIDMSHNPSLSSSYSTILQLWEFPSNATEMLIFWQEFIKQTNLQFKGQTFVDKPLFFTNLFQDSIGGDIINDYATLSANFTLNTENQELEDVTYYLTVGECIYSGTLTSLKVRYISSETYEWSTVF